MVHKKWTIIIFFYITFLFSTPSCWSIGTIIGSTKNVLEMDGLVASNQALAIKNQNSNRWCKLSVLSI